MIWLGVAAVVVGLLLAGYADWAKAAGSRRSDAETR
jgi:hypothetical protein